MPSTYSSNLRLELITAGEQANTWGNTTNTNLGTLLESSIAGRVELSSGWAANSLTLSAFNGANDQSRQMCLVVPAITISANSTIIVPASAVTSTSGKLYTVINKSLSYSVTIKLAATTGVTIPANTAKTVIYNGTDFQEAFTALALLTLTGAPTTAVHAVNKGYVDNKFFSLADNNTVTGNTSFTGTVALPTATPTGNQATSYNYVNENYLWKAAGVTSQIMNPFLRLNYTPTNDADAVHKAYVDAQITTVTNGYLPLSGGTLTGALTLAGAPTTNLQPATKLYVDNIATSAASTFLPFTGGTLTGVLTLAGAPTTDLQAATKLYVDNNTSDKQPLDGDLTAITALTGGAGFLKKTGFETWALDTNSYITGNQTITLSGAITGSGTTTITTTLADSPVVAGTYTNSTITVNAKGIVTSASNGSAFALPTATDTTLGGVKVNGNTVSISGGTLFLNSTNVGTALGYTACRTDGQNASGVWTIDTSGSADYLQYAGSYYTANQFYLTSNPSGYVTGTGVGASGTWNINILGSAAQVGGYSASQFVLDSELTTILTGYPTVTGVGATGTGWGISITGSSASCTGNAATATSVAWSGVTSKPTNYPGGCTGAAGSVDWTGVTSKPANYPGGCTGNAATATTAAACTGNAATAGSVPWSGITSIPVNFPGGCTGNAATATTAAACTGNAATASSVPWSGITSIPGNFPGGCTGNAATATSVSWSGITGIPGNFPGGCTGNAATATSATTATFINGLQSYSFSTPTYDNGTSSPVGALFRSSLNGGAPITAVNNNNTAGNGASLILVRTNSNNTGNPTGTGAYVAFFYGTSVISGAGIFGDSTTVSYLQGSDYRLKQNIVPVTGALDRVQLLNPVNFEFKANPGVAIDGFLAHEVAEVAPRAVNGEKDAVDEEGNPVYQGVDHSKLVPLLVAAIKELKAEIAQLKGA